MPSPTITVDNAHAAVSRDASMRSSDFQNCNLLLIKNISTGDVLMMHSNFAHRAADDFFVPRQRRSKAAADPDHAGRYSIAGISEAQAPVVKAFLEAEGEKYGLSIYKDHHDSPVRGGQKDWGLTKFLESKGVKMRRFNVPVFGDKMEFFGFDADYSPHADTLHLSSNARETRQATGDAMAERLGVPDEGTSLLRIHLFADLKLWDKQKGAQR